MLCEVRFVTKVRAEGFTFVICSVRFDLVSKVRHVAQKSSHVETENFMSSIYYLSAWTDSGCFLGCEHEHSTVTSAAACISCAGGYVIAVEKGALRTLNDAEEAEFQTAMFGTKAESAQGACSHGMFTIRITLPDQGRG
jgi:hypothetical protein